MVQIFNKDNDKDSKNIGNKDKLVSSLFPEYRSNLIDFLVKSIGRNGGYLNLKTPDKSDVFSRNYVPQDPISRIDWKAFSRTDSLIIREKPKEAHSKVLISMDVSESMNWKYENDISKKELAFRVGMFLGGLHLKKEDLVRVVVFDEKGDERFFNVKSFSDIIYIFNYYIEGKIEELLIENNNEDVVKNNEVFSDLKHFSYYDLSYVFSDALSLEYGKYFKYCSIFFHTLSSREIDINSWISKNEIYYCKDKDKKYSGSYLLKNDFYMKRLKKWLESKKKTISKQSSYMLLSENMNIEEFCLDLNNILKDIKR